MNQKANGRVVTLTIDNLNSEGQGVGRLGRDVYFVPGALVGETVTARMDKRSKKIWHTRLVDVLQASPNRVEPLCPHYQRCGGCQLQHLNYDAQVDLKQQRVARELSRQHVEVPQWQAPLQDDPWHYRRKARLGVRYSKEQKQNFVGFREDSSAHLTNISQCAVLPQHPALNWDAWRDLIGTLDAASLITQIEPLWADNALAFVLRVLKPLSAGDQKKFEVAFAAWQEETPERGLQLWVRTEKHAEAHCLWPNNPETIWHEVEGLKLTIQADDFIQVNAAINRKMVAQALAWLAPEKHEVIWDLFAGHGNFSMPLATHCQHVVAVEGQESMVSSLKLQAEKLALSLQALRADLSVEGALASLPMPNAVLLDPPRAGASAVMPELIRRKVGRILYVSCDPATLARDLAMLAADYKVTNAGIMDMFPQTHHVETMVMLEYRGK